jgi:hypothetical protein
MSHNKFTKPDPTHPPKPYQLFDQDTQTYLDTVVDPVAFPSQIRFPVTKIPGWSAQDESLISQSPAGSRGHHPEDKVTVQTIWHPLWDTQEIYQSEKKGTLVSFFTIPHNQSEELCNVPTCGHLSWPKMYHVWEIELQFNPRNQLRPSYGIGLTAGVDDVVMFGFTLGECDWIRAPVDSFYRRAMRINSIFLSLPVPILIPSVLNFRPYLRWPNGIHQSGTVRCILHGHLHREVV